MLSTSQDRLYWREVGAWARARKALGLPAGDAERRALTRRACGHDKSHKHLYNAEFDKVLGLLRAESRPDDLNAQMRQIEQGENRKADLISRCWDACRVSLQGNDAEHTSSLCQRYMSGIAYKLAGRPIDIADLTERDLQKLLGVLDRRARQVERKRAREAAAVGETDPNPF